MFKVCNTMMRYIKVRLIGQIIQFQKPLYFVLRFIKPIYISVLIGTDL